MHTRDSFPYKALYQLSRALHSRKLDVRKVIQTVLTHVEAMIGVPQGSLIIFDADDQIQKAYVLNAKGSVVEGSELWETLVAHGLVGFVYHAHRTIVIRDIASDPRWPKLPDTPAIPRQGSAVGLPLYRGRAVFGVMLFIHPQIGFFDDATTDLLEEIAELAAVSLNEAPDTPVSSNPDLRYQTLFDDAVVPILLTDLEGNIIDVNHKASELLSYDRHDLLRRSITVIHQPDISDIAKLDRLLVNEEVTFRSTATTAHGDEIPVIVRMRRLRLDKRDVVEWIEQDITAQMELEQLRRDLSAMVYHDLRGPLQAIGGSIQKLAEVLANHENPAVLTLLQVGVRSTRQLRRMVDSLLDVQRLEEGRAILNRTPVEPRVLLADATQLVQPLAMDSQHVLRFDIQGNLPLITMDSDMIMRVVINLMENAIKYTPSGGSVILGAGMKGEQVYISVSDTGPGIPADMQQKVFDKFNRVKYQDAPKGVGLGLAFCRLAVKAHGGDIWVESEPGQGSKFVFTLPVSPVDLPDSAISELATA